MWLQRDSNPCFSLERVVPWSVVTRSYVVVATGGCHHSFALNGPWWAERGDAPSLLVVTPLIPAGTILIDPVTGASPLATRIALSTQASPIRRRAKRARAQLGIGERGQGDQSGWTSHGRNDEPHERVDDGAREEFAERGRVAAIGPT